MNSDIKPDFEKLAIKLRNKVTGATYIDAFQLIKILELFYDEVNISTVKRLQEEKKRSLAFLKEAEAWLSFNNHPSKENISDFKNSLRDLLKQLES